MSKILNDKSEFENDILKSNLPAMVDFFATWCGPCKMLSPVIDEIATEMEGKAVIAKVDSDQLGELCADYSIKLLPTLVFFKDGKEVDRIVGMADKEDIIAKLNSLA
ncbi:thioredoxin [uncultured Tyzzerella sp.]|uniref:thioredoxin n=1 Tax=uncultured Tyzzerella sp. TaxID=2321398 RepID=UPI002942D57B|nr:thioredoxin [uncultured Tyzzerella sp.]